MLKVGDRIELSIARLSAGGRGVGRHEGFVVFVPLTAPNETVLAEVTLVKKSFSEAKLISILQPSPHRIAAPCPVADQCGGCSWQHVEYSEQLRQKQALVSSALKKFAGRGAVNVLETVASPEIYHYRNRIQLHYRSGRLGYHRRGSHDLINIDSCLIADARLNSQLTELRAHLQASSAPPSRFELSLTRSGDVIDSRDPKATESFGFSQVNQAINERLIEEVVTLVPQPCSLLLDLYAGDGNLSFPLRTRLAIEKIIAVELHSASVARARQTITASGFRDFQFVEATVEDHLHALVRDLNVSLDPKTIEEAVVILDPPRSGCHPDVMPLLARLRPQRVIYVSCDPVTLARDLGRLPNHLYQIRRVRPFDMFPQTDHVESVVCLDRVDKA